MSKVDLEQFLRSADYPEILEPLASELSEYFLIKPVKPLEPVEPSYVKTVARTLFTLGGLINEKELNDFLTNLSHPELFEELSDELLPRTPDGAPFIYGMPITNPPQFFGRERVLRDIGHALARSPLQHVAVIGPYRSGKTSLLHYLRKIPTTAPSELRSGPHANLLTQLSRYRWIFVDFQYPSMQEQDKLLQYLLTELGIPVPDSTYLSDFMDAIIDNPPQQPTVILMDEICAALKSPKLDHSFWEALRSLTTNFTNGNLAFILTSTDQPARVAHELGNSSPFFNIFRWVELKPWSEAEARQLIDSSPIGFSEENIEWILEQSQPLWPCLVQFFSYECFKALQYGEEGEAWKEEALKQINTNRYLLELINYSNSNHNSPSSA